MKRAYLKYIVSLLLFGSNGIVASRITLSSYEIVLLRTMIGSFLLIAVYFAGKGKLTFYQNRKQFLFLCVSGIAMSASWIFLYEAYAQIGSRRFLAFVLLRTCPCYGVVARSFPGKIRRFKNCRICSRTVRNILCEWKCF